MFCQKCGQENEDSAKFCSSCGNGLSVDAEKSAEQKAEDIKQKSKESASTLFYLIKPLLKAKVLVPSVVVLLAVIFWSDMKSAYENYQYEKEKLAKEKRETFTDPATGLMWQDDHTKRGDFNDAISYCKSIKYAGFTDWELPSKDELKSLYIKKTKLKMIKSDFYWSSIKDTSYFDWSGHGYGDSSDWHRIWFVDFGNGAYNSIIIRKSNNAGQYYVRCVRDKQ